VLFRSARRPDRQGFKCSKNRLNSNTRARHPQARRRSRGAILAPVRPKKGVRHRICCGAAGTAPRDDMPEHIDALICPRWTVAIEPEVRAVEGLALAIDAGRIKALLPEAEARARFAPDALHERPDHVLLPGLGNAHCHG